MQNCIANSRNCYRFYYRLPPDWSSSWDCDWIWFQFWHDFDPPFLAWRVPNIPAQKSPRLVRWNSGSISFIRVKYQRSTGTLFSDTFCIFLVCLTFLCVFFVVIQGLAVPGNVGAIVCEVTRTIQVEKTLIETLVSSLNSVTLCDPTGF